MSVKEEFIEVFENNITRDGNKELLKWLLSSDFFTAPASTKFHSAYEGGLAEHSLKVYNRFLKMIISEYGDNYTDVISNESIAIIGLLHDVCKVNSYKVDYRNVKDENGNWTKQPYYTFDEELPYGHGEKSVYIISSFIKLTREEAIAINWHMGGFDARVRNGGASLSDAYYKFPIAAIFNAADTLSTYLDEER
ncbi:MAG: hydrolase [Eubacteriales bacterium]|nr:hydrolase [Eubacteriales bacterium]